MRIIITTPHVPFSLFRPINKLEKIQFVLEKPQKNCKIL